MAKDLGKIVNDGMMEYSTYVIQDRALPDYRDGLKPVQRRILWTMFEDGSKADGKYLKCAAPIGTVLARYHPHGDTAAYGALVSMAGEHNVKDNSYHGSNWNVPLIDGYGNFGSIDDIKPSYAAYRYTECRITTYADELIRLKHCIPKYPNFLNNREQPIVFPATLPFLLLNGGTGIAVGTTFDMQSHNLGEVCETALLFLKKKPPTFKKVCNTLKGPDWRYGGKILDQAEVAEVYRTGRGVINFGLNTKVRKKGKKYVIDITGIPPRFNIGRYKENLAKEPEVKELKDFGDNVAIHLEVTVSTESMMKKIVNKKHGMKNNWNVISRKDADKVRFFHTDLMHFFTKWIRWTTIQHKKYFAAEIRALKQAIRYDIIRMRCLKNIDLVIKYIREENHKALRRLLDITVEEVAFVLSIRLGALANTNAIKVANRIKDNLKTISVLFSNFQDTEGYLRKHYKRFIKDAPKRCTLAN